MRPEAVIEAILLAAGSPISLTELSRAAGLSKSETLEAIEQHRSQPGRGVTIVSDGKVAQLVTAPELAEQVARFTQSELRGSLSPGALETLAIIAYRGPVTRSEIEAIRGVSSSTPLRTLSIRGLVEETGRRQVPGRPFLYDTSLELLKHLGIRSKTELPAPPEATEKKLATAVDLAA